MIKTTINDKHAQYKSGIIPDKENIPHKYVPQNTLITHNLNRTYQKQLPFQGIIIKYELLPDKIA